MQVRTIFFLVIVLGIAASAACGDEGDNLPSGNLAVSWLVGTSGCDQLGVETVAVLIEGGELSGTNVRTFQCGETSATISGLPPGIYDLTLRGRDAAGVDRFQGIYRNAEVRSGGTTTVGTIRLTALPATIDVTWYFDNGRMCAHNDVDLIGITLFEDEYEVLTAQADCALGGMTIDEVPANSYIIDVVARDSDGIIQFNGQEEIEVDRGDIADLEVRLLPIRTDVSE